MATAMHVQAMLSAIVLSVGAQVLTLTATAAGGSARAAGTGTGCQSDDDCHLNGVCSTGSGVCSCVPEWTGPSCGQLNLLPAKVRPTGGYDEVGNSSWGGSIVEHNGTWHMMAARMVGHCGLGAWQQNSEIVRATATDPEGP